MRIIGGIHAGLRLNPPANLPVRPTTDMAKEALFNILQNRIDFEDLHALDLFSGTGNIAFELASRRVRNVVAVDIHSKCVQYIGATAKKMRMSTITAIKANVLKFVTTVQADFDFIFADPPYDLPQLPQLADFIFSHGLLRPGGMLVLEHPTTRKMDSHQAMTEIRKYGYSSFTFYQA